MNITSALKRIKEIEKKEYEKDRKKGIKVRINPESYAVKELEYQTLLLREIKQGLEEIKMLLKKPSVINIDTSALEKDIQREGIYEHKTNA